jgi:glycogen debranching enzyme
MEREPEIVLLPGERIVSVQRLELVEPPFLRDPLRELCALAGVERADEIGENGPVVGARVSGANVDQPAMRLFEVVFGRDSLVVALMLEQLFPKLLEATVVHLGGLQGRTFDPRKEEEPGRIAHEIRDPDSEDEVVRRSGWGWPYYGSVDATALYVQAAAHALLRRPRFAAEPLADGRTVVDAFAAATDWLLARLAANGALCHRRVHPNGLENQVWKDSWDSYFHADGTIASPPIASLEAQALAYDALLDAAALLPRRRGAAIAAAARLRDFVHRTLWVDDLDGGFYGLGADSDPASGVLRPLAVRGSQMGWLLNSRIADGDELAGRRRRTVELLCSAEFLAAGGIRTLSTREARYRPRAYHNGSVWPHDTYFCSQGFARNGFTDEAAELRRRIVEVCRRTHRYPEFVAGNDAMDSLITSRIVDVEDGLNRRHNRIEQPPQEIVAWCVGAYCAITLTP